MYIGNNRGLLVFDGIHWDLVKLPNNLGVRALYISKDGRIYVGSFEEFGYFEMDDENDLIYHSLSSSEMNVYLNNDEFWTINEYKGEIYFQSFRNFFVYDGEKVRKESLICHRCIFLRWIITYISSLWMEAFAGWTMANSQSYYLKMR